MLGTKELNEIILESKDIENLFVAPSNIGLVGIEKEFYKNTKDRELVLKRKLDPIKHDYDYIIIDSPPALGPLNNKYFKCCYLLYLYQFNVNFLH